ncbi:MAG: hypothetical protein ACP5OG_02575 [Candidatus Nanoarchaeia archaeon]
MEKDKNILNRENKIKYYFLIALETALLVLFFNFFSYNVYGVVGENVTVITYLEVGNVFPEIYNVSIENNNASINLIANDTHTILCNAIVVDYNGDQDIKYATAEIFDTTSSYGASEDNNNHYNNLSCNISNSFGSWNGVADDEYTALVNCTFNLWYYANPNVWNCTVFINDTLDFNAIGSDNVTVNQLLSIGLPDSINYGKVNASYMSDEKNASVINYGNVKLNLSLYGYGSNESDGLAMNCTTGSTKNISIEYEMYNLSYFNISSMNLVQATTNYLNLSGTRTVRQFNLGPRNNDTLNEAWNNTYWRIYVPRGVAGNCTGRIVFGATVQDGV